MPAGPSLLIVATIAQTVRGFLIPYARHFRALGWRVDAAASGGPQDDVLRATFDHVYELPLSRSILDVRGMIRGEAAMSRILVSRPDIVHVHTPIASFITRLAVRRMHRDRRPLTVYTAHGFHFHRGGGRAANTLFLAAEKLAGRWTDRLVVINDEDYEAARRNRIVAPERLMRMPGIGIDTDLFSPLTVRTASLIESQHRLAMAPDVPLFVVVAELSKGKRNGDIIQALHRMRHREATVVLAGAGPERHRLEALAGQLGVTGRVVFAGFVDDVRPLVRGATALVLASEREGLARSVMEALALEVPVIASTARGNAELVGTDAGLIFPVGDSTALAAAMDWLIEHPVERLAMGRRGRARMATQYDVGKLIGLHEEMYLGMLREWGRRDG